MDEIIKFFKNMFNFKGGDRVHMSLLEMALYGGIPMIGQLMLRIDKLGGSLDHPWLLFPLFLIPPFSFIPVLMAKFGFIKNTNSGKPYDFFMWIPVIFRIILIFILTALGEPGGIFLKTGLILASLFVTNLLHAQNQPRCKDVPFDFVKNSIKLSADSMIQYSSGVLANLMVLFIPILGQIIGGLDIVGIPYVSDIIDTVIWSIGMIAGYILTNMYDANYSTTDIICNGKIPSIRIIISCIAVAIAFFYKLKNEIL